MLSDESFSHPCGDATEPDGFRHVPAADGALVLDHVDTCMCGYRIHPDVAEDIKVIDRRCIDAYRVPTQDAE